MMLPVMCDCEAGRFMKAREMKKKKYTEIGGNAGEEWC